MDELREEMEKAFDQAEAEIEKEIEATSTPEEPPQEAAPEEAAPPPQEAQVNEPPQEQAPQEQPRAEEQPTEAAPQAQEAPTSSKPPASWTAGARETWGNIPAEAQKEVLKREKEVTQVLQQSAAARRAVQELNSVLSPHSQRLMAAGVESPIQMIGTLLATEGQLRGGTQMDKANILAQLINNYGVDVQTLDAVLSNSPTPPEANNQNLDSLLNEKLAPYQQFMQQQQQAMQQQAIQSQQNAQASVNDFATNAEFINDVRLDMADLMDMAANRGQEMSLQDAYNKACAMNPQISKILADRERQNQMMGQSQAAQAKKNAAVSISGQQGGQTVKSATSLHDQIAQAWQDSIG